jgi:hypothetical protein
LRDTPPPLGAAPRPGGWMPVAGQVEAFCDLNGCDFRAFSDLIAWSYDQIPRFTPDEVSVLWSQCIRYRLRLCMLYLDSMLYAG